MREEKRGYISQSDIPRVSLKQALRIPRVFSDNFANRATKPLRVAEVLETSPTSTLFRELTGAAIAYGLTEGGYNAELISITTLGRRAVAPTSEGDDTRALREAGLRPRIIRAFLEHYNNASLPANPQIAKNLLEEMGVPRNALERSYGLILETARELGFLREIKGRLHVDIDSEELLPKTGIDPVAETQGEPVEHELDVLPNVASLPRPVEPALRIEQSIGIRVFITHGKNTAMVNQLKELLTFGKFEPIVSVEREGVSKPVPEKVMDDMRSCFAAIIHVGTDTELLDDKGDRHRFLNPNVLIEIGAAMALYPKRFILLVEDGVTLPSNLQGLYEVRYSGEKLDYDATMKLLKAFNEFRK
jgi:predicted nucleotide-binding protein